VLRWCSLADHKKGNRHRREQVEVNRRPFSADLGGTAEGDPELPFIATAADRRVGSGADI
jgi:hypothetical protein